MTKQQHNQSSSITDYQYLLFAFSFMPNYCCSIASSSTTHSSNSTKSSPKQPTKECPASSMKIKSLTPHGLWPTYDDNTYKAANKKETAGKGKDHGPVFCKNKNDNEKGGSDQSDPNKKNANKDGKGPLEKARINHQFIKHAACISHNKPNSKAAYNKLEEDIYKGINEIDTINKFIEMQSQYNGIVKIGDIHNFVSDNKGQNVIAIKSDSSCFLQELTFCLSKSPDPKTGNYKLVSCPNHIIKTGDRNSANSKFSCKHLALSRAMVNENDKGKCMVVSETLEKILKKN